MSFKKTAAIALAAASLVFAALMASRAGSSTSSPADYAMIHKPPGGCPSGWRELPKKFTEADGSTEDACLNPNGDTKYTLDMLKGGESVSMRVDFGVAVPGPEPTPTAPRKDF